MKTHTLIELQNRVLEIGVRLSILMVFIGAGVYLFYYGSQPHIMPSIVTKKTFILEFKIVEYGLYTLILIQFTRLFFVLAVFFLKRDFLFFSVSIFVLGFLGFSMFFPIFFHTSIFL